MRRKLTMAIMSLVIAASLLTTATFAWFNMSESVEVGSMDMTVQTVGSLYIRTHDFASNIDGNTRAFRTSIDIPKDSVNRNDAAGIQPTVSLYRFAQWLVTDVDDGGAGLDPSVLNPVEVEGVTETQEEAYIRALTAYFTNPEGVNGMFSMEHNDDNGRYELDYFADGENYPELFENELFFDVKERMMRAANPMSSTEFVIAGDNMDYGKWNFDLLSAAQNQTVKLTAILEFNHIDRYIVLQFLF